MRFINLKLAVLLLLGAFAYGAGGIDVFGRHWTVYSAQDWAVTGSGNAQILALRTGRDPLPGPRRPFQFALTDVAPYRTLSVEGDVRPLQRSLMIVFAYQDEAHFDYAHLSVDTGVKQPYHNGVFHVYGGERVRISSTRGPSAFAASRQWYHFKLTHQAATGEVNVLVDGKPIPALHAIDLSLGAGRVGLGSFDETAEFKNIKITADN